MEGAEGSASMLQYLKHELESEAPTMWSVDNYDGPGSWEELSSQFRDTYKNDGETGAGQSHKMMFAVHQWEGATDDIIQQWDNNACEKAKHQEWRRI